MTWAARRRDFDLWRNEIDGFDELRRRHVVPQPPYGQGAVAAAAGAQAMIDISDGLVADLRHVAEASGVGMDLSTAALAADRDALAAAAAAVGADPWHWVLGGGEDHALVACFAGSRAGRMARHRAGSRRAGPGARRRSGVERLRRLAVVLG